MALSITSEVRRDVSEGPCPLSQKEHDWHFKGNTYLTVESQMWDIWYPVPTPQIQQHPIIPSHRDNQKFPCLLSNTLQGDSISLH